VGRSLRSRRLETPLRLFTSLDTATFGEIFHQQVVMVFLPVHFDETRSEVFADAGEDGSQAPYGADVEDPAAVF